MSTSPTCARCHKPLPAAYDPTRPCPACLLALGLGPLDDEEAALLVHTGSGEAEPPPEPHELAELFPQLEIIELLGQGGMGAVYRARQTDLDRDVALKILAPRTETEAAFAERFARAARALAKLSHPNLVAVHDFGKSGPHYYIVMELVEGTNLRHLIHQGDLSSRQALEIVEQVCSALQYAHDQGVVHRDIKPENILIDRTGRAKIADFGLAKMTRVDQGAERLTRTQQAMGTPQYMAPEQIEHPLEVDHRADIYSLGVVFYELLTGELPLGRFAPPTRKVQVDVRLDEVVLRALEKEPEQRYQQASEVATDLGEIKRAPQGPAPRKHEPEQAPAPESRERPRGSWGWVAAVLALVVLMPAGCLALVTFGLTASTREAKLAGLEAGPAPGEISIREGVFGLGYLTATLLGVALLAGVVFLVVRALRGSRRQERRSLGWGWIVVLLLLISCVPLGCFALLIPATTMRQAGPTPTSPPLEFPPPSPVPLEASEEELVEKPMPTDEEIRKLYDEEQ
jgi:tRNA A-37 threonylcarbamoyl transferase component Bud32